MVYDMLFTDEKGFGVATTEQTPEEMAAAFKCDPKEVYQGRFRIVGARLVKSAKGDLYTYWSKSGPFDMCSIGKLSEHAHEDCYFFRHPGMRSVCFEDIEEALESGYTLDECYDQVKWSVLLMLISCGLRRNEYVKAVKEMLAPYLQE